MGKARRNGRKRPELPPTAGLPVRYGDFIRTPPRPFADSLADWLGLPLPALTCSGTAALVVALHTLRALSPDRNEVILPAYTCPLVSLALRVDGGRALHVKPGPKVESGLRAVVCDTVPGGFDFDPVALARLCTKRTLALVPTHLGGRVADVATAKAAAEACGAAVIEDAAQALGARDAGQSVGLAGDAGLFSLAVGKGLTTYEGGVLFGRDPALHEKLCRNAAALLPFHPLWSLRRVLELAGYAFFYRPDRLWHAYGRALATNLDRNDELAAVGDAFTVSDIPLHSLDVLRRRAAANAFGRLPAYLEQGRQRALSRLPALKALPGCAVVEDRPGAEGVWPFIMLLMPGREQRDLALQRLWREGAGVSKLFVRALPDYPGPGGGAGSPEETPNARDFAGRMLTITNTHWLDRETFARLVQEIGSCL